MERAEAQERKGVKMGKSKYNNRVTSRARQ